MEFNLVSQMDQLLVNCWVNTFQETTIVTKVLVEFPSGTSIEATSALKVDTYIMLWKTDDSKLESKLASGLILNSFSGFCLTICGFIWGSIWKILAVHFGRLLGHFLGSILGSVLWIIRSTCNISDGCPKHIDILYSIYAPYMNMSICINMCSIYTIQRTYIYISSLCCVYTVYALDMHYVHAYTTCIDMQYIASVVFCMYCMYASCAAHAIYLMVAQSI